VIGHHHVSDDAKPEKSLKLSHKNDEVLPFLVTKDEPPVNDTGAPGAKRCFEKAKRELHSLLGGK